MFYQTTKADNVAMVNHSDVFRCRTISSTNDDNEKSENEGGEDEDEEKYDDECDEECDEEETDDSIQAQSRCDLYGATHDNNQ